MKKQMVNRSILFIVMAFVCGMSHAYDIVTRTVSDSYSQEVMVQAGDYYLDLGNSTAYPGYTVCGIQETALTWSNYRYYTTYQYSLIKTSDYGNVSFVYSDDEYNVGDKIEGKTILAKSTAFSVPVAPSKYSGGVQYNYWVSFKKSGSYSVFDTRPATYGGYAKGDGDYKFAYCVEGASSTSSAGGLNIFSRTVNNHYQQKMQGTPEDYYYKLGNKTAFPGYTVCGIQETSLTWNNYEYQYTMQYSVIKTSDYAKVKYIYSNDEYNVGDKINGKTILAKSTAFCLPYTPGEYTGGIQYNIWISFSKIGLGTCDTHPNTYAGYTKLPGAFKFAYCVEKY